MKLVSFADFVIVGFLQMIKRIDEGIYEGLFEGATGLKKLHEGCAPLLKRDDY